MSIIVYQQFIEVLGTPEVVESPSVAVSENNNNRLMLGVG